jgi:putative ABC transport system permease protein
MLKNYLKVACRILVKNRLISFINIFGLGLSMSVGMMIMIRLQDQLSYDNFHPNPGTLFRVINHFQDKSGQRFDMASTPLPLRDKLAAVPGVEISTSIYPAFNGKLEGAGKEISVNGAFTDPSFFKVFGFTLFAGNPSTALSNPNAIIITKDVAERYFGHATAVGKTLKRDNGKSFLITGVLNDPPSKSHIHFDAFVSASTIHQMEVDKTLPNKSADWFQFNTAYTYITTTDKKTVEAGLRSLGSQLTKDMQGAKAAFALQSINNITPGSDYLYNEIGDGSSWSKFYFEIGIALIILLAACFNYTNLTVARSLTRAKEVGIRKINGAKKSQLFLQYIIESTLVAALSLVFAWILLSQIVRYAPFNDSYEFIPSSFQYNTEFISRTILFALFTGILAGVAPAWMLSNFKPLRILKNMTTARMFGNISVQKTLIVFQYTLSLTILIFLLAFYRQFAHLGSRDPGFRKENVLVVPLNGLDATIVSQRLTTVPGVQSVSAMSSVFGRHFSGLTTTAWISNRQDAVPLNYYYADGNFIRNMGLSVIAGKHSNDNRSILLNEQGAKALGLKDISRAVGQQIWINDSTQVEITGILKDFNYENAGSPIRPLALMSRKDAYSHLYVSVNTADKMMLTAQVRKVMFSLQRTQTADLVWLDDQLAENNSQGATISLLGYLAFMAMAIATLGLLGLVIYTVQTRRKEISIRKIIGAGSGQLVRMLSRGFIKLLLLSGIIAVPLGYVAGYLFLQNFTDRVSFGVGSALLCFCVLLAIGLLTIISQTYKAAVENPAKSLRSE